MRDSSRKPKLVAYIKKAPTFVEAFPTLNSNSIQWSHLIWSLQKLAIWKN
jgi:hypothetical protein